MFSRQSSQYLVLLCTIGLWLTPLRAQDDAAKDHPNVPRFPGFTMDSGKESDFDSFDFPLGEDKSKTVEGKSWQFSYAIGAGARHASPLEIIRNYSNQFKARGGQLLYQEPGNSGATMMMPLGAGERWLHLTINNDGEQYMMAIIESAAMKQKLEVSAGEMADQLAAKGSISLHGILFDTGKTVIQPASDPLLDEVASMLKANGGLRLEIQGHTDNVGAKAANMTLSNGRAESVKAALVSRGVTADRLTTKGFGDTKPVGDNNVEAGREQNRRVELVKQ